MSRLARKIDIEFWYRHKRYSRSGRDTDLLVDVADLTARIARTRLGRRWLQPRVKADLERRANAGELRRWVDVRGRAAQAHGGDFYVLHRPTGSLAWKTTTGKGEVTR